MGVKGVKFGVEFSIAVSHESHSLRSGATYSKETLFECTDDWTVRLKVCCSLGHLTPLIGVSLRAPKTASKICCLILLKFGMLVHYDSAEPGLVLKL